MQSTISLHDDRLSKPLGYFPIANSLLLKGEQRYDEKGREIHRFIGTAEIIDKQGEIIDLSAVLEIMPIMQEQGARINGFHSTQPAGEFVGWDVVKLDGNIPAMWLDVAIYDKFPSQKENLRRLHLPDDDPEKIRGISIGGKRIKKHKECNTQTCYLRTTEIEGWEWSLVDKPANPLALLTEEFEMSMAKSLKAKEQDRNGKGMFSKNQKGDCPCDKSTGDKEKIIKVKCLDCGQIHEHNLSKNYEKEEEDEYEEKEEMPEGEPEADMEAEADGEYEASEVDEMSEDGEDPNAFEGEAEADMEKPPMEEGVPETGMPEDYPSAEAEGGNDMSEEIGYIKMQLDKLMTALNIEKAEETPTEYVDAHGNVYKLEKGVTKERSQADIIKGLEDQVTELSKKLNLEEVPSGTNDLAKHDAGAQSEAPKSDIKKMNFSDRLQIVKEAHQRERNSQKIFVQ